MAVQIARRLPQAGRIRIGRKGSRGEPVKLETFRLTSQDRKALEDAAKVYGGRVTQWGEEWELITTSKELPVYISPEPISQYYEEWSAAGCKKRCDGNECQIPDGKGGLTTVDCDCDPQNRKCGLKTRVSFLLPDLAGLSIWRLDTGSYYAAAELPDQLEMLQRFKSRGQFPEARLCLDKRKVVRQGKDGKPQTRIFPVVSLRVDAGVPLRALVGGETQVKAIEEARQALPAPPVNVDRNTGEIIEEEELLGSRGDEIEKLAREPGFWLDGETKDSKTTLAKINKLIGTDAKQLIEFDAHHFREARDFVRSLVQAAEVAQPALM